MNHTVRVECLNLIGQLSHVTSDSEISLVTLEEYCADPDPRVRAVSLQGLVSGSNGGTYYALLLICSWRSREVVWYLESLSTKRWVYIHISKGGYIYIYI